MKKPRRRHWIVNGWHLMGTNFCQCKDCNDFINWLKCA